MLDILGGDEEAALESFAAVAHRFGWSGPLYSRKDVAALWLDLYPDRPFTDEMWEAVRNHPLWQGLHATLTDDTWVTIGMILHDVSGDGKEPDGNGSEGTT